MNLVPDAIGRGVARSALLTSKHSPTILFGVGVVGMIGSTVLACRATLKLDEMIEDTQEKLKVVKESDTEKFSDEDRKKATAGVLLKGAGKVAKAYAPAVIVGAVGIACLTKSHNILMQRNTALVAAYTAVDQAFKNYRRRVVEKYGPEEDLHMMHEHEPVEILSEKGNITHSTRVTGDPSMYARYFDHYSTEWTKGAPEYNYTVLTQRQRNMNEKLITKGHVFLNEVYDALGLSRTEAGSVVGWILTDDGSTDNHIDFGIHANNERARDFVNGREDAILLDFNVDGIIFDKIEPRKMLKPWQS